MRMNKRWQNIAMAAGALMVLTVPSALAAATETTKAASKTDEYYEGTYRASIPVRNTATDEEGQADVFKIEFELQLRYDQTYYLISKSVQNEKAYKTEYGRGIWSRDGNVILLKDSTKNSKEPMFRVGNAMPWSAQAQQHANYYTAQLAYGAAWTDVRARCPFWTANGMSYGIESAISEDKNPRQKSFDEKALLAVKKLADDQVDDALKQFFLGTPGTDQWNAAAQNVNDAYARQDNAYASMAQTLHTSGRDQYDLTRKVPPQCGAPGDTEPSLDAYVTGDDDNTASAPSRNVGIKIHDPDYETVLRSAKITATLNDKSVLQAETIETGWAFFKLPAGKNIISLAPQIDVEDGRPIIKNTLYVSITGPQIQDIAFDSLRAQRPLMESMMLRINDDDLVFDIENMSVRFVRDMTGEYAE
jgi:NlpE N-terminal domain